MQIISEQNRTNKRGYDNLYMNIIKIKINLLLNLSLIVCEVSENSHFCSEETVVFNRHSNTVYKKCCFDIFCNNAL